MNRSLQRKVAILLVHIFALTGCVGGTGSTNAGYATGASSSGGNDGQIGGTDTGSSSGTSDAATSSSSGADAGSSTSSSGASSSGASSSSGSSGASSSGGTKKGPTDAELAKAGVIKMQKVAGNVESASAKTDKMGVVGFYSPHHNALIEINGVQGEKDKESALGQAKVTVRVEQSGAVFALIVDPAGKLAPAYYAGSLTNGKVEVSSDQSAADNKLDVAWNKDQKSPFPGDKFTLVGISVSMVIRFALRTAITMAVTSIVKNLVNKTCLFFNPLYTGWCSNLAEFAKEAAGVLMGGLFMKFDGGLTWSAFGWSIAEAAGNWLIQKGCEKATGAFLVSAGPVTGQPNALYAANMGLWKKVAHKALYMIKKDATNPVANPAKKAMVKAAVKNTLRLLAATRNFVQMDLYMTVPGDKKPAISDGKIFTFTMKMVENIGKELKKVVTTINLTTIISSTTTYVQLWDTLYVSNKTFVYQRLRVQRTSKPWLPKGFSQAVSCAIGLIDGVGGYIQSATNTPINMDVSQFANDALKLTDRLLDEVYASAWGGTIATPSCYPDIFEPNNKASVKQAVKNLGQKVTIDKLSMTKGDVDWFTLPLLGAWAKVQAGVAARKPDAANDCGTVPAGAKLCVQMYWYSNIIELAGTGPAKIGSEHCGVVGPGESGDPQVATQWWNVSKVTGEQGQTLLVRVRQPSGQNLDIPYRAFMFAGGIF